MSVLGQQSIQGDTKIYAQRVDSAWHQIVWPAFCLRDVYLDGKHMIRSCLDLVAIAIDGSTGSVQTFKINSRFGSQSENDSCWYVSAMSSAYLNWFDNAVRISVKYRLNSNGAKTLP
jgi:hypothetical protein